MTRKTFRSEVYCPSYRDVRFMVCPLYRDSTVYNKEQDYDSVNNSLKFVGERPEQNKTTHLKNYQYHYQPPQKRYDQRQ